MNGFQIVDPFAKVDAPLSADAALLPLPGSSLEFEVRRGTMADLPWVDAMQKTEREGLGFRFMAELEGHVREGNLWIAERQTSGPCPVASGQIETTSNGRDPMPSTGHRSLGTGHSDRSAIGYCIARNRYMKRDELGLIVQMFIAPGSRRSLVAANFLQRMWEQWPSGVKLCGCWCAQDLPANKFWEKCGFRALAFRTGSRETTYTTYDEHGTPGKKVKGHRIHIYWQKRVRQGDTQTPYWFPSETGAGSIGESRLVFPIPPGTSWRDAKPSVLPGVGELFEALRKEREAVERQALKLLPPAPAPEVGKVDRKAREAEKRAAMAEREAADAARAKVPRGALRFGALPPSGEELKAQQVEAAQQHKRELAEATKQAKKEAKAAARQFNSRNDPALVAMARELRDRWMQAVEHDPRKVLSLPSCDQAAKVYDVGRQLEGISGPLPGAGKASRFAALSGGVGGGVGGGVKRVENTRRLAG